MCDLGKVEAKVTGQGLVSILESLHLPGFLLMLLLSTPGHLHFLCTKLPRSALGLLSGCTCRGQPWPQQSLTRSPVENPLSSKLPPLPRCFQSRLTNYLQLKRPALCSSWVQPRPWEPSLAGWVWKGTWPLRWINESVK